MSSENMPRNDMNRSPLQTPRACCTSTLVDEIPSPRTSEPTVMMVKCYCKIEALETLLRNIAGLQLHQQRAQFVLQRYRSFSTRAPLRQVEIANAGTVEDGFVPSEMTRKLQQSVMQSRVVQEKDAEQSEQTVAGGADGKDGTVNPQSHADIDTNGGVVANGHTSTHRAVPSPLADEETLPELVKPAAHKSLPRDQKVQRNASTEARRLRKERRMWEGKYKPTSVARMAQREGQRETPTQQIIAEEHSEDSNQVQHVLAKLDQELGGPSIIQAQQQRAERLASQSSEKNRKARMIAAKEHEQKQRATAEAEAQRRKQMEPWMRDKAALQNKFGAKGWAPNKRLSPDSLEGIRALHKSDPETYNTAMLSEHFQITPEAIRRILKSKWKPQPEEIEKRMERWEARGVKKWQEMSELGMKPPKKWRMLGVANPKLEGRPVKKWEDQRIEAPIDQRTGKKGRWRDRERQQTDPETSLAHRL